MGWDIKVPETSCPYYLNRFIHYSCSNWINKTGNCNEEKCPVKISVMDTDIKMEIVPDNNALIKVYNYEGHKSA